MNINGQIFARTVRRIHRGQTLPLPFFQTGAPPSHRDRAQWYNARSEMDHVTQHIRSLDIKTLSFQASEDREDLASGLYTEPRGLTTPLIVSPYSPPSTSLVVPEDDLLAGSSTEGLLVLRPPSNYSFHEPERKHTKRQLESHIPCPSGYRPASTGYDDGAGFSRGQLKVSLNNSTIQTSMPGYGGNHGAGYGCFKPPSDFFSRAAAPLPSLLYSLAPKPSEIDFLPDRDWNQEFNEVLESPLMERAEKLRVLEKEFVEVASIIGKIIISERNLHPSQKSVKAIPLDSGIAGGEKYQVKGIFFKFAVDHNGLYGSDENAMKVACHELKGHTALVSCGMMYGLKLGLMTVIDYQGSRLTAISMLPISQDTLVYGSADGGKAVCTSLKTMNDVMKQCSKVLNLKGHLAGVGADKKFIYGPCDLEGHLGHDGRLYAIDLARLFPPETPEKAFPGGFLYRLLRPELVRQSEMPLSSDAFTLFGQHNSDLHDAEVRQATDLLHQTIIPEFARALSAESSASPMEDVLIRLHRAGINIRFLGEVRSHVTDPTLRRSLLTEIYARVFKNEIRRKLRECKSAQPAVLAQLAVNFFNTIFGAMPVCQLLWAAMKRPMHLRFKGALNHEEMQKGIDLRDHVDLVHLYQRLQDTVGITFNASLSELPLTLAHFSTFVVQTKQMYTVPRIEADTAAEMARTSKDLPEAQRLLTLAREKYHSVLELKPDDYIVLSNLGMVLAESAMIESDEERRKELFEEANERFRASLQLHGDDPQSLVMWSDVLINQVILMENCGEEALQQATSMCLQAERSASGIGAVAIARAAALHGETEMVKKWLHHASITGNLPPVDALVHDPAFRLLMQTEWFMPFLEETADCSQAMAVVD